MLTRTSVVSSVRSQLSSDLGGETVILHLDRGMYFGLNEVGSRIWQLVQEPTSIADICAALMAEYEVDAERCERVVLHLVQELTAAGLAEISDGPSA